MRVVQGEETIVDGPTFWPSSMVKCIKTERLSMIRGPEIKLSPTILFDFWVFGELGPQKGAKKAIWALCRSIFRPWWPIAITHQKCVHTSSGAQTGAGG